MDQAGVCLGSKKLGDSAFGAGATPAEITNRPPPPRRAPAKPRSLARAGAASAKPIRKHKVPCVPLGFQIGLAWNTIL
jgi:hypothetical protein